MIRHWNRSMMQHLLPSILLMYFMDMGVASLSTMTSPGDPELPTAIQYIIQILFRLLDYLIIYILSKEVWDRRR